MLARYHFIIFQTAFLAVLPLSPAYAQTHSGDVALKVIDNQIVTGSQSDRFLPARVFSAELGEIVPNEVDEPGFDNEQGTFQAGSAINFDIVDALRKWDGTDFDAVPSETMGIHFGTALGPVSTPMLPTTVNGFGLNVASDGSWHRHYDFVLSPPATQGIYLLSLRLVSSDRHIDSSDPFFIVFNQNETELHHEEALAYVESVLVPEPHSLTLGLLGLLLALLLSRFKR